MLFEGQTIKLSVPEDGIAELKFERAEEAVNKLDALAFQEFAKALDVIAATKEIKGVLVTSGKENFIVGADIFEFTHIFKKPEGEIENFVAGNAAIITSLADLGVPSLAAIRGLALGGGFEVALAADYRVMARDAKVGFPEIHLGIFPGYGGTVRLPRLIGLAAAADWILSGAQQGADQALEAGAIDAVSTPDELRLAGRALLLSTIQSPAEWRERRARLKASQGIAGEAAHSQLAQARGQAAKTAAHFPAGQLAVQLLEEAADRPRDEALALEAKTFAKAAKTQAAESLVTIFINEQAVKKELRRHLKDAPKVEQAAVAGAGVMGGGIAYQSASRGVPIVMKDVSAAALDHGLAEASKLLAKSVEQGRLSTAKADAIFAAITPSLTYEGFDKVDVVIEAIVEDIDIKHRVLREIEAAIRPSAILASNTSSLRIGDLAEALQRPENFLGMHFFNPVPRMPLVEVVHGPKTSARAIATVMGYAAALGKTPILVADCPGFIVNRVLTPYLIAALRLIHDGADFVAVDKAMENFGWPMGPAYLMDVIGLDISQHVVEIVSAGFAPRMDVAFPTALQTLLNDKRLGQKNGHGFYRYQEDAKGRPRKEIDPKVADLLAGVQPGGRTEFPEKEIVARMMLPFLLEAARCVEDQIAASPAEVDMCLILGLGFPRYLGGALKYADYLGLKSVVEGAEKRQNLGPVYQPSAHLRAMAAAGEVFYPI